VYEKNCVGQDVYPLPSYTSAFNWAFLDGEMSYLQKSNILNAIFPSFAFMFPKKPQSEEEKAGLRKTIESGKGARNGGKVLSFFANNADQLPKIEAIPTNNNDNLFQVTTESIDSKICQAHTIDPILMGIRVSGKLGSGSDIKQSNVIFEKNVIFPQRRKVEKIVNDLFKIAKLKAEFHINNFQIINDVITERDEKTQAIIDSLNSLPQGLQQTVLNKMTDEEIRSLVGLKTSDNTVITQ
jgi:capsid portal protein